MSSDPHWLERARKLVSYHREALDFVDRVKEQFEAVPGDAQALCILWTEADALDETVCTLLNEMNDGLIDGAGEVDITRGASVRPDAMGRDTLFYDCSWSLRWGDVRCVSVNLAIEPGSHALEAQVRAQNAGVVNRVPTPMVEADLKESLVTAYAAEATTGDETS